MELLIEILSFINDNYLKFAIGLILILMALIGYHAEKTNFGNKFISEKQKEKKDNNRIDVDKLRINDFIVNGSIEDGVEQTSNLKPLETEINTKVETEESTKNSQLQDLVDNKEVSEEDIDEEFEKIIPKEQTLDCDLITDINNMEVKPLENETNKSSDMLLQFNSNIDLPEIDNLKTDEDIWKF